MNIKYLYTEDGKKTGFCYCGKCSRLHYSNEEQAEQCCSTTKTCPKCNLVREKDNYSLCDKCRNKEALIQEIVQVSNATRLTSPSTNMVYLDGLGRDGYFELSELDDLDEIDSFDEKPCYVWDCDKVSWSGIDVDNCLDNELSGTFDDALDHIQNYSELASFIAKWNEKQSLYWYQARNDRIIVLDEIAFNKFLNSAN